MVLKNPLQRLQEPESSTIFFVNKLNVTQSITSMCIIHASSSEFWCKGAC